MGHLKANYPKIPRQYPLNNDIAVVNSVDVVQQCTKQRGSSLIWGVSTSSVRDNCMGNIAAQCNDGTVSPGGPSTRAETNTRFARLHKYSDTKRGIWIHIYIDFLQYFLHFL